MKQKGNSDYLKEVKIRISKEMPRILKEVKLYEQKQKTGQLSTPIISPQFIK